MLMIMKKCNAILFQISSPAVDDIIDLNHLTTRCIQLKSNEDNKSSGIWCISFCLYIYEFHSNQICWATIILILCNNNNNNIIIIIIIISIIIIIIIINNYNNANKNNFDI